MTRRSSRAAVAQKAPKPPAKKSASAPTRGSRAAKEKPAEVERHSRYILAKPAPEAEEPEAEEPKRGRGRSAKPTPKAAEPKSRGRPAQKKTPVTEEPKEDEPVTRSGRGARSTSAAKKSPVKANTSPKPAPRSTSRRAVTPPVSVEEPPAKRARKPPRKLSPEPEIPKPRARNVNRTASSDADEPTTSKKGSAVGKGHGRGRPANEDATSSGSDTAKPASNAVRRGWGRRPKPLSDESTATYALAAPKTTTLKYVRPAESESAPVVPSVVEEMKIMKAETVAPTGQRLISPSRQMAATSAKSVVPMARADVRPSEIPERGRPPKNAKNIVRAPPPGKVTPMTSQQVRIPTSVLQQMPRLEPAMHDMRPAVSPPKRGRPKKTQVFPMPIPEQSTVPISIAPRGRGRPKGSTKAAASASTSKVKDVSPNRKRKLAPDTEDPAVKKSKSENGNITILPQLSGTSISDMAAASSVTELAQKLSEPTEVTMEEVGTRPKVVQLTKHQQDQLQSTSQVQFVQQEGTQRVVLLSPKPVAPGVGGPGSPPPRVQLISSPNSSGGPQIRVLSPGQKLVKSGEPVRLVQVAKEGDKLIQILPSSPGGGATKVPPQFGQYKVVQVTKSSGTNVSQTLTMPTAGQPVLVKTTEGMRFINVKPAEPATSKPSLIIPAEKSPTGQPIRIVQTTSSKSQPNVRVIQAQPGPQKVVQSSTLASNIRVVSSKGGQPTMLTQEQAAKLLNQSGQQVRVVQQPGSPVRMITVTKSQPQPMKIVPQPVRHQIIQANRADDGSRGVIVTKPQSLVKAAPSILKAAPIRTTQPQQIIIQKPSSPIRHQVTTTQSLLQGIQSVSSQLAAPVKIMLPGTQQVVTLEQSPDDIKPVEEEVIEEQVIEDTPSNTDLAQEEPQQPEPDLTDYVVVDMAQVPQSDSVEVMAAQPSTQNTDVLTSRTFLKNVKILESNVSKDHTFSIASYNILSDHHMRALGTDVYNDMDAEVLDQSYRHERLMKELEYLSADVVCLQECEMEYYSKVLETAMKGLGYSGVCKKRLGDHNPEGEATFYRTSRFTVVHNSSISLKDLSDQLISQCSLDESTKACIRQYLTSDELILITKLRCNHTMKELTVGNVHIKWTKYKQLDLQCVQVACAVKELVNVAGGSNNAYVLCGDFNALPTMAPYQLARDGYLNDESIETLQQMKMVTMPDGTMQSLVNLWWQGFKHTSPNLQSAYVAVKGSEPVATTVDVCGPTPKECVDYILCSPQAIQVLGVLECPSEAVMQNVMPLPNDVFPSDHVSVKAKLAFK